jgi:very-short-patch-repair endonuclease
MSLNQFKKQLRSNQTDAESTLWYFLRAKRFGDFKFKRQEIIGSYIVDFVCYEKRLVIELDGSQHQEEKNVQKDARRTSYLESQGFRVLRFWNHEIFKQKKDVLEAIF